MNRGVNRGIGGQPAAVIPEPKRLAIATSITGQTGITTITDITGLSISFTVTANYPVEVEVYVPWISSVTGAVNGILTIADTANTAQELGLFSTASAGQFAQCFVKELITVPGAYSRKVRVERSSGSGTVSTGAGLDTVTMFIKATEIRV